MKLDYTIPKISFDKKKGFYYVWYRAKDPSTGKRKFIVEKKGINLRNTLSKARYTKAKELRDGLIRLLDSGNYNPFGLIVSDNLNLLQHLNSFTDLKKSFSRSPATYKYIAKNFTNYLVSQGWTNIYPENFTKKDVIDYMDHLQISKKYSGKTYNNHLNILRSFFNSLVERDVLKINPFRGVRELPEEQGKYVTYTDQEKELLFEHIYRSDTRFFYAVCFTYYCFIRRSEVCRLKVGDINMQTGTITLRSTVSKNLKQESVTIPATFIPILKEMQLDKYPDSYYIIGYNFLTSEGPLPKADYLSEKQRVINDRLNISKDKCFYSWKHTGVCKLYEKYHDILMIMRQCRHSDPRVTMRYLRAMGLIIDEVVRRADF